METYVKLVLCAVCLFVPRKPFQNTELSIQIHFIGFLV